ncbi:unnamed protein product [Hapterophycus canaliculatus]
MSLLGAFGSCGAPIAVPRPWPTETCKGFDKAVRAQRILQLEDILDGSGGWLKILSTVHQFPHVVVFGCVLSMLTYAFVLACLFRRAAAAHLLCTAKTLTEKAANERIPCDCADQAM